MVRVLYSNIISVLRRFKLPFVLNVLGLMLSFTTLMVTCMQIQSEIYFEANTKDVDRIFRLDNLSEKFPYNMIHPYGLALDIKDMKPQVEALTAVAVNRGTFCIWDSVSSSYDNVILTDPDFFKVFAYETLAGNLASLRDSDVVVIPEKLALKHFGSCDVIGKVIYLDLTLSRTKNYRIGAVYRNPEVNSHHKNAIFVRVTDRHNYDINNYLIIAKMREGCNVDEIAGGLSDRYSTTLARHGCPPRFSFVPYSDIYFRHDTPDNSIFKSGDRLVSTSLFVFAVMMLIVSAINVFNMYMAVIPLRIKSINLHKILGLEIPKIRLAIILETVSTFVIGYLLSLVFFVLVEDSVLVSFLNKENLRLGLHPAITGVTFAVAILLGLVVSAYPAVKLAGVNPSLVINGRFGLSHTGRRLRRGLLLFQFTSCFACMLSSLLVYMQISAMSTSGDICKPDNVIAYKVDSRLCGQYYYEFLEMVKENPDIENVAFSVQLVGGLDFYTTYNIGLDSSGRQLTTHVIYATPEILNVFGIGILEGRNFTSELNKNEFVADSAFLDYIKEADYLAIDTSYIVGISQNTNLVSKRQKPIPTIYISGFMNHIMRNMYVSYRNGAIRADCIAHIAGVLKQLNPAYDFEPTDYGQIIHKLYRQEWGLEISQLLITGFTMVISIIGLVLILIFEGEYRRKEVGVRKVFGASVADMVLRTFRAYMKLLCWSFCIAAPAVYVFVSKWQENFLERIALSWWPFVLVFAAQTVLVLVVVGLMTIRTALRNPVDAMK